MARDHERQLDLAVRGHVPARDRAVALLDPVLAKRGAQPLPLRGVGRDQERARRVDVEPVHHAAAQPALADPLDLRMARRHRAEQRPALARDAAGARARPRACRPRASRARARARTAPPRARAGSAPRRRARRRPPRRARPRESARPLSPSASRPPADPHRAAREQPPRAAAREREPPGEEDVEAAPGLGRSHLERFAAVASGVRQVRAASRRRAKSIGC